MTKIVGVSFRHQCKIYSFGAKSQDIPRGAHVIVETSQGVEYGTVIIPTREVPEADLPADFKSIIRVATEDDDAKVIENERRATEAGKEAKARIAAHGLDMKLIQTEYTFDRNKLTFYFTSDGRVDFRELVRDLAARFHTRIDLRQVGVRDESRIVGGIGTCGRELCCATWLTDFAPVSIKMAKEQNLALTSMKISGTCGRLMCCLRNEAATYEYLNAKLPNMNQSVKLPDGRTGTVKDTNALLQTVSVLVTNEKEETEQLVFPVSELKFTPSKKQTKAISADEEKELKKLED